MLSSLIPRKKNWRKYAFVALIAFLFLFIAIYKYNHTFSSDRWKMYPEKRGMMLQDLLETYSLIGMSEGKVVSLLGNEDLSQQSSFKGDQTYYPPETTLVYFVKDDLLESVWMIITLEDGLVKNINFGVT